MEAVTSDNGIGRPTKILLWAALGLTLLHQTDHVMRVDHSGWPFKAAVTSFTFSLFAFPMGLFALFGSARLLWWRWSLLALGTAATIFAHTALESPQMQFAMWAQDRSSDPRSMGVHNLLHVRSEALGFTAVIVSMALNIVAAAATIAMLSDAIRNYREK